MSRSSDLLVHKQLQQQFDRELRMASSSSLADSSSKPNVDHAMRDDVLKAIFGDGAPMGHHLKDYSCAVQSGVLMHGRMYVTDKCICFYSNLFGIEKKLRIPLAHVKGIVKSTTALLIPNAIIVSTDQDRDYVFRSFWRRDKCFNTLARALEDSRHERSSGTEQHVAATVPSGQLG